MEQAAATAARAGVGTLVLTHYVPPLAPGQEDQWRALAAAEFSGPIEIGDDLLPGDGRELNHRSARLMCDDNDGGTLDATR